MDKEQAFKAMKKATDDYAEGMISGDDLHSGVVDYTDAVQLKHFTADGFEVTEGGAYWDNGLHLVTVTKVASFSEENRNPDSDLFGQVTWWHDTTGGMADGSRLAKRHPFTREPATLPVQD